MLFRKFSLWAVAKDAVNQHELVLKDKFARVRLLSDSRNEFADEHGPFCSILSILTTRVRGLNQEDRLSSPLGQPNLLDIAPKS